MGPVIKRRPATSQRWKLRKPRRDFEVPQVLRLGLAGLAEVSGCRSKHAVLQVFRERASHLVHRIYGAPAARNDNFEVRPTAEPYQQQVQMAKQLVDRAADRMSHAVEVQEEQAHATRLLGTVMRFFRLMSGPSAAAQGAHGQARRVGLV